MATHGGSYPTPGRPAHIASADLTDHNIEADRSITGELERRLNRALRVIGNVATVAYTAIGGDAELAVRQIAVDALTAEVELYGWLERNAAAIAHYRAVSRARVQLEDACDSGNCNAIAVVLEELHAIEGEL